MGNKNKKIREELERIYGKGCMFQRAYVEDRLRQINMQQIAKGKDPILTYRTYKKKYTLNQQRTLERRLTLHHLKHVSEGGSTNIENGAIVNELAHRYLHTLKRKDEELCNDMMRDYKRDIDNGYEPFKPLSKEEYEEKIKHTDNCNIELMSEEEIETPFELHVATGTFELDIKEKKPEFKPHKAKKKKYNRAKQKRKTNKLIKRYYGER